MRTIRVRATAQAAIAATVFALSLGAANGATATIWSIQRAPARAGATASVLQAVSCTSRDQCVAVGGPDQHPGVMLTERWNGSRWKLVRTVRPAGSIQSFLSGVSCVSPADCAAVGFVADQAGAVAALTTWWNGARWTTTRAAKPPGSIQSFLDAVSCTSRTECTAVGGAEERSGLWFALAERWNGSRWSIQPTPRLQYSELAGVSCASARACTAVGFSDNADQLIEHWNGRRWWRDTRSDVDMEESALGAVSCTSPTACAAVGAMAIPSMITWPLLETWHGSRWAVQPIRAQPPGVAYGVACTSTTRCTAVGADSLVEELKRGQWSIDRVPDLDQSTLYGVSCTGGACVAVGAWIDRRGSEMPLVESTVSSSDPAGSPAR